MKCFTADPPALQTAPNGEAAGPETGSASLWLLSFAMVVCLCAGAVVVIGVAVAARHRAATAADLSALAGAAALAGASPVSPNDGHDAACAAAEAVVRANGARLVHCDVGGLTVEVVAAISLRAQVPAVAVGTVTATARAGPE